MKAVRIFQLVGLLILAAYVLLIHNANPQNVILPFFLPLPTSVVIIIALLLGWLVAWLSSLSPNWTLRRENRKLQRRLSELEGSNYRPVGDEPSAPVIPDRDVTLSRSEPPVTDSEST